MQAFFSQPKVQKTMRYVAAYSAYAFFAIAAIVITESLRQNVLDLCKLLKVSSGWAYMMYSWGSYILYLPYVVLVGLLEPYMNKAARTGQVWEYVKKVLIIEGGIGLVSVIGNLVFVYLRSRMLI